MMPIIYISWKRLSLYIFWGEAYKSLFIKLPQVTLITSGESSSEDIWAGTKTAQVIELSDSNAFQTCLRHILNLAPRDKLWPPGAKLSLRSEFCPLRMKLSSGGEIICSLLHSSKQWRVITPVGERRVNISPRGKLHPWGQTMLLKTGFCCVLDQFHGASM
jgi:hypothetical protein